MGADTPGERFEDIDWDAERTSGLAALPRKYLYLAASLLGLVVAFCYDYFLLPDRQATVQLVKQDNPDTVQTEWLFQWNVSQVDWMFIAALLVMVFLVVLPLYNNPRRTRYYWQEFKKNRAAVISLWYLIGVFFVGTVAPLFIDPPTISLPTQYQPPMFFSVESHYPLRCVGEVVDGRCHGTMAHPLGTTQRGKDLLNIVIYGMQVSMKIGLVASMLIITIGTAVGTTAAYVGGLVDEVLMRYVDIQLVFPSFLLYLLLIYLFGGSLFMFIVVFGLTSWGGTARLVRSEALQRAEEEYITAADSAGASTFYVIWRHIVPNVSNTVITNVTLLIPGLILFEAGLAFLDLGDPTIPSWGQTIAQGRDQLTFAWWISTIPGFFLFLTILAFNFLGDALRDALDPRAENRGGEE